MSSEALVEVWATGWWKSGNVPRGGAGGRVDAQAQWEDQRLDNLLPWRAQVTMPHLQHAYIISHLEDSVFAQHQASWFFSGPFLIRRDTFFWMTHFSTSLKIGCTEKALGMETNCYEKGYFWVFVREFSPLRCMDSCAVRNRYSRGRLDGPGWPSPFSSSCVGSEHK